MLIKIIFFKMWFHCLLLLVQQFGKTASNRPYIKVTTRGGTSDWLFDSGASVTCMSVKAFRQIPPEFRPEKLPNSTKLVDAGGNNLVVQGVSVIIEL